MADYFVDTSALAKRYVNEDGTRWVRKTLRRQAGNNIIISELSLVELTSVMVRREAAKELLPAWANRLRQTFYAHAQNEYQVIAVNSRILMLARAMILNHAEHHVRTLDAIQLATALETQRVMPVPITFVCSDRRLLAAAQDAGFAVVNPITEQ